MVNGGFWPEARHRHPSLQRESNQAATAFGGMSEMALPATSCLWTQKEAVTQRLASAAAEGGLHDGRIRRH
jgi:hypothetical protein